jgi:hypothetical protein
MRPNRSPLDDVDPSDLRDGVSEHLEKTRRRLAEMTGKSQEHYLEVVESTCETDSSESENRHRYYQDD